MCIVISSRVLTSPFYPSPQFKQYTRGNRKKLNNNGVGYREKLAQRYEQQGKEAALYREAMLIRARKEEDPSFKIYVIDGEDFLVSQVCLNLQADAPSFGPVAEWMAFIDGGCLWMTGPSSGGRVHLQAFPLPDDIEEWLKHNKLNANVPLRKMIKELDVQEVGDFAEMEVVDLKQLSDAVSATLTKKR
jgi:hypothetical protein